MLKPVLGLFVSYILGSVPTAYLFGKIAGGIDLRKHGSGNLGATNAFRILGTKIGTIVLALDIFKGTLAVLLMKTFFQDSESNLSENLLICLSGISVVSGHNWTVFLGFKGGKGVATSLGVLVAFSILIDKFVLVVVGVVTSWLLIFILTGFVSLASVISSAFLPLLAKFFNMPREIFLFLVLLSISSLIRHKSNIIRLLYRTESRFNTRALLEKILKKTLSQ